MEEITEFFQVYIPSDSYDSVEERNRLAFIQAEEEAPDWIVPCQWDIESVEGEYVTVARSYRRQRSE